MTLCEKTHNDVLSNQKLQNEEKRYEKKESHFGVHGSSIERQSHDYSYTHHDIAHIAKFTKSSEKSLEN